jgi:hypothetical protein
MSQLVVDLGPKRSHSEDEIWSMVSIVKVEEGNKLTQYGLVFAMQSRQFCVILSSEMGVFT